MRVSTGNLVAAMVLGACVALFTTSRLAAVQGGGKANQIAPCPSSPNCVSTVSEDDDHAIAPIVFEGSAEEAKAQLLAIVRDMPRTRIAEDDGYYVHAEFRSRVFRFVDDVEFLLDDATGHIYFRSASRVGRSDLGVNRRRMEAIRDAFASATEGT